MGYFYSFYYKTPLYKSSSTILLVNNNNTNSSTTVTQSDLTLNQKLVSTYSEIITSKNILDQTIKNLNIDMNANTLSKNITVSSVTGTEIIKISVTNANPELAANITNELVKVFSEEVKRLYNIDNVNVIDQAKIETVPYNVNHIKDLIAFSGMGIVISALFIFIVFFWDNTIKDEKDIENYIGLSTLAKIPLFSKKSDGEKNEIITQSERLSPIAECFRNLKMNLTFKKTDNLINTILVTSVSVGEGKSWTTANLASIFAQANQNVLIIDSDMRKGRQHKIFKVSNNKGLSNCLISGNGNSDFSIEQIAPFITETNVPGIHLLTSGTLPPNPSELLSSEKMKTLLKEVHKIYDIIIIDGCPCKIVSDSIGLVNIVDTSIIVVEAKKTKIDDLKNVKQQIENIGGKIGGVVLNKISISAKVYKSTYYYGDKKHQKLINEKNEPAMTFKTVNELIDIYNNSNLITDIDDDQTTDDKLEKVNLENIGEIKSLFANMNKKINSIIVSDKKLKEEYANKLNPIQNSIEEFKSKLNNTSENFENLQDMITGLSNEFNAKISELKVQPDNTQDFENLQDMITDLSNEFNARINELKIQPNNAQDFENLQDMITDLSNEFNAKISELKVQPDNTQDFENLQDMITGLSNEFNAKINELKIQPDNTQDFENLQDMITGLSNEFNAKINELKVQPDNTQDFENLQDMITGLSNQFNAKINELKVQPDNTQDFENLQDMITGLSNEFNARLNEIKDNSTNQQYEQLRNSIANIKDAQQEQRDSLSISLALKDLTIICNSQKHLIEQQVAEISSIKNQLSQLQKNVETLKKSNEIEIPNLNNQENVVYFDSAYNKVHNEEKTKILNGMFSKKRKNEYPIYETNQYNDLEINPNGRVCQILNNN